MNKNSACVLNLETGFVQQSSWQSSDFYIRVVRNEVMFLLGNLFQVLMLKEPHLELVG